MCTNLWYKKNALNKTAASNISENLQLSTPFFLHFQITLPVALEDANHCMQQDAQARNQTFLIPVNKHERSIYTSCIVQMGHDHMPNMKLYWTKDKL
jgi:hypothetical protein